jgi:glycosyltransferase involved in cell wall biosynthesis
MRETEKLPSIPPDRSGRGAAVCIIVENSPVPPDRRVWREAVALSDAGYHVSIISPKGPGFCRSYETIDGIEIYRHRTWEASGPSGYALEYGWSLIVEFLLAIRIYMRTRFRILQACNPPDTIFLIALFFKILGVRFIFDQHDPVPEFFEARFRHRGFGYRLACLAERLTFRTANVTIVTNESCRDIAANRGGVPAGDCFIVRNCPDVNAFRLPPALSNLKQGRKYLVVYLGTMGTQDGIDLLLKSIDYLVHKKHRVDTLFVLIGGGSERAKLETQSMQLGLSDHVKFVGPLYDDDLRMYLATADVGVSPDPSNIFNDKLTMVKILEYMACGLPLVLYDLPEGRRIAGDAALYAKRNECLDFAERIAKLLDSESLRYRLGTIGKKRIHDGLNWDKEKCTLLRAYEHALKFGAGDPTVSRSWLKKLKIRRVEPQLAPTLGRRVQEDDAMEREGRSSEQAKGSCESDMGADSEHQRRHHRAGTV